MGFGSVIATAMAIVVLLAAGFALAAGIASSAGTTGAALKDAADRQCRQANTALTINNLSGSAAGGYLTFSLNNVGNEKIDNLSRIDVVLKFLGADAAAWFPYRDSGAAPYWTAVEITSLTPGIGDAVNPGMLDPGETMLVRVVNATAFPGTSVWAQAAAPNGVSASCAEIIDS